MRRPWLWFAVAAVIVMLGGALAGAVSVLAESDQPAPSPACARPPCGEDQPAGPSPSPDVAVEDDVSGPCDEAEHEDDPACDEAADDHADDDEDSSGPGGGGNSGPG